MSKPKIDVILFSGVQNLPLFAAENLGFFRDQGLDVTVTSTPNSWELRDGLAQGLYQVAHTAVDNAVAMVELAGHDVAVVMGGDNGFNCLIFQKGVKDFEDLRGQIVLVDAPNTAFALALYRIMQMKGLERSDYQIVSEGGTHLRLARMLKDETARAAVMNLPFHLLAEQAGLQNKGEITSMVGPYLSTAGFVMRDWGKRNEAALVSYIKAYVEGLRWSLDPKNRAEAVKLLQERLKLEPTIAEKAYEIAAAPGTGLAKDAAFDMEGFKNVLAIRAKVEGQWGGKPPAAEKYVDLGYWKKATSGA